MMTIKEIKKSVLNLTPAKRFQMVEFILNSLHKPDPEIERAWALESDRRITAHEKGLIKSVSYESIKKRYKK